MPFAQQHYPFENQQTFESSFPADFIAEGIDQTRGWFYTLLVISTALFNKPPFKNLIANGLVLASDGQKMSKRKKNYPDPLEVVHKYGADALRLYLINSPVVRAENLRFKEEGVRDIIKDVFLPWFNAYRFLFQNIHRYVKEEPTANGKFQYNPDAVAKTTNTMDVWILSFKESLLDFVAREMKAYRLYTVVPRLTRFIDQLTNWYVRLNRRRIKGESGIEECVYSLNTLFDVLDSMVKMMAPFTPYLSEYMYQRLSRLVVLASPPAAKSKDAAGIKAKKPAAGTGNLGGSVHLQMMPKPNRAYIRTNIELAVGRMQSVIELGRVMRDRRTMPVKYPVPEVIVIQKDEQYLNDIKSLEHFIMGELNARQLTVCADKLKYGVQMRAEPDHKTLGLRLKADFKAVMAAIKKLTDAEISAALEQGYFQILGNRVELEEVRVIYTMSDTISSKYETHSDNEVLVLMDFTPTDDLLQEGLAREIINRVQKLKKKAQLIPTDPVVVYFHVEDADSEVRRVASSHQIFIESTIKSPFLPYNEAAIAADKAKPHTVEDVCDIKGIALKLTIRMEKAQAVIGDAPAAGSEGNTQPPTLRWVNVVSKVAPRYTPNAASVALPAIGTVLIEDENKKVLTLAQLHDEIVQMFGLYQLKLYFGVNGKELHLTSDNLADSLKGATVVVSSGGDFAVDKQLNLKKPAVRYANVNAGKKSTTVLLENPKGVALQRKN